MASDDVIELGSSDEDIEPVQKKRKFPPNAIVQIPTKLPGVTIKPAKSGPKINPACIARGTIGKSVTVTKVPKGNVITNPHMIKSNRNGRSVKAHSSERQNLQPTGHKFVKIPIINAASNVPIVLNSPIIQQNIAKSQNKNIKKTRTSPLNMSGVNPFNMRVMKPNIPINIGNSVIKRANSKSLSYLPPGITVKKTSTKLTNALLSKPGRKPLNMPSTIVHMTKVGKISSNEVLTVDLDDDEPATSSVPGPQWYLRPEDDQDKPKISPEEIVGASAELPADVCTEKSLDNDTEKGLEKNCDEFSTKTQKRLPNGAPEMSPVLQKPSDLEKENNKEPDKTNFIEITIEDSPIKPAQSNKCFKVGAELAITIDDSPIKVVEKIVPGSDSDEEKTNSIKKPNSKKKLQYPKTEMLKTIEIEIEPLPIEPTSLKPIHSDTEGKNEESEDLIERNEEIVEIEESPIKPLGEEQAHTPKKSKLKTLPIKMSDVKILNVEEKEAEEFHPVYRSFINLCFQLENSEDMRKIVEKKIKAYYRQVPKEYTESELFIDMVSSKITAIKAGPDKMYLYIKDIVDELNLQRKLAKSQLLEKLTKKDEQEKFLYGEESEFDSKRQRQIRKLEKTLKKLHRAIQKLEDQEVDFDDEEDSVYLLTESEDGTSSKDDKPLDKEVLLQRYKERMVRVHAKFCQLTNTKMPSEPRVQIDARPGQPKGPAKRLEKWVNRKVPIGTPLPFPDFHDVLRCVRDANQEDNLGWNEADIMEEARDLFTRCGKKLQRRRQENEWRLAASRIQMEVDPAENSEDLKKKLNENKKIAAKKETEVLNKYADRQYQLKLEAVEIGDKEAEESPVESDDEESIDDNKISLENKEKQKKLFKRLIREKSKKVSDKNEYLPRDRSEDSQNKDTETKASTALGTSTKDLGEKEKEDTELKDPLELEELPNRDLQSKSKDSDSSNNENEAINSDTVHLLSDDSNKVESDIDKLHILQKCRSGNEINTSMSESSDAETTVISDSSSDENKKQSSDVISIENSSYSESEERKNDSSKEIESECLSDKEVVEGTVDSNMATECSNIGVEKKAEKTNNDESIVSQEEENTLLASSDDADNEADIEVRKEKNADNETCINLRDDNISIGETVIEEFQNHNKGSEAEINAENTKSANTDDTSVDSMEIDSTEVHCEIRNGVEANGDTTSIKSTDEGSVTEITSVKSMENEERVPKTTSIKSIEDVDVTNINETNTHETIEAVTIPMDEDLVENNHESSVDITEKTATTGQSIAVEEAKGNSSIPEVMEVDTCIEQS